MRPETETDGLPPNNTNCCEPCASDSAGWNEKPWNSDDIFEPTTVNTANFYNPQYLQDNTPTSPLYSGIGYNTRPIGYDLDPSTTTPMESTLIGSYLGTGAHGTIEQVKQNLFVCKKTNFPNDHTSGWGHGDIGGRRLTGLTEQAKTALDSTHGCDLDKNGDSCQIHYKYFDSTTRDASSERYLWMKDTDDYLFQNDTTVALGECPTEFTAQGTKYNSLRTGAVHRVGDSDADSRNKWNEAATWFNSHGFNINIYDDTSVPCDCNSGDCWGSGGSEDCDGIGGAGRAGHNSSITMNTISSTSASTNNCHAKMYRDSGNDIHVRIDKTD